MDEYAEEKRTEKNLIVRSGISEAETTNNKRLRSMFSIEAIQTQSIARPLCDSRASCSIPNVMAIFRQEPPPPTGALNAGGVGRNGDSEPISVVINMVLPNRGKL